MSRRRNRSRAASLAMGLAVLCSVVAQGAMAATTIDGRDTGAIATQQATPQSTSRQATAGMTQARAAKSRAKARSAARSSAVRTSAVAVPGGATVPASARANGTASASGRSSVVPSASSTPYTMLASAAANGRVGATETPAGLGVGPVVNSPAPPAVTMPRDAAERGIANATASNPPPASVTAPATSELAAADDADTARDRPNPKRYELRFRLDDGRYRGFHQDSAEDLRTGDGLYQENNRIRDDHRARARDLYP